MWSEDGDHNASSGHVASEVLGHPCAAPNFDACTYWILISPTS